MRDITPVPFVVDLDTKSISSAVELGEGELLIEGWALNYDIDREDEAFGETSAIHRGLAKLANNKGPVCFHHDYKTVLGRVVESIPVAGKGVMIRAIIDKQPEGSPWRHYYDGIKSGSIKSLSLGGIFRRKMTAKGPIIHDADFLELSVCGTSVGRGTTFAVVAGKALSAPVEGKAELTDDEQAVVVAEKELEREDLPQTPAIIEAAPEKGDEEVSEEDAQRQAAEGDQENEGGPVKNEIETVTITAESIPAGAITAAHIAANSITAEHFSDDLRSRFSELKPQPEEPSNTELAAAIGRFEELFETVGARLGIDVKPKSDAQKVGEDKPNSGVVILGNE